MTRHTIQVTIDSEADLGAIAAERFVFNAINTVRTNLADGIKAGIISGAPAKAIAGSVMYVAKQSSKMSVPPEKWSNEQLAKVGNPIQDMIVNQLLYRLEAEGVGKQKARDLAGELVHLFMGSALADPGARALYATLPESNQR